MFATYLVVMNQLSNLNVKEAPTLRDVMRRFYFQPHLLMVIAIASGMTALMKWIPLPVSLRPVVDLMIGCAAAYLQVTVHWEDHSQAFVMENFAKAVLDGLPLDAYVFVTS
jgi:hypothetical protein